MKAIIILSIIFILLAIFVVYPMGYRRAFKDMEKKDENN